MPPKCSTNLRPRVGPSPGVSASASQCNELLAAVVCVAAEDPLDSIVQLRTRGTVHANKNRCQAIWFHHKHTKGFGPKLARAVVPTFATCFPALTWGSCPCSSCPL